LEATDVHIAHPDQKQFSGSLRTTLTRWSQPINEL
jgi:hypothetical protein